MISLQKTLSGSKLSSSVAGERGEQSRACAAGWAPRGVCTPRSACGGRLSPGGKAPGAP